MDIELKDAESYDVEEKLQNYCKLLLHATRYDWGHDGLHYRIEATIDDMPDLKTIKYVGLDIRVDEFSEKIPAFPCFREKDDTMFFITYGFTEDYAFVFMQQKPDLPPVLFGMTEPTPIIGDWFDDRKSLEKFFIKVHSKREF